MTDEQPPTTVLERLDELLDTYPNLAERIYRQLLVALHTRGVVSIDGIQDEALRKAGVPAPPQTADPNRAERDRWDERVRATVEQITRDYLAEHFEVREIEDLVNLTIKREEVHSLEDVANSSNVSFRQLRDHIRRFCELPLGETQLAPAEVIGTRVALIRHFVSDQLEFIGIAKNYLRIRDFDDLASRIVGSDSGMGRIGGKAGGMVLAHRILDSTKTADDDFLPVAIPESYYLRSDVVEDFLRLNRLHEYQSHKYKPTDELVRDYPLIKGVFRNGDFPLAVVQSLRRILDKLGNHPLIIRSSSLLEDRLGTAFCGKYASVFLANQGDLEHRLRAVLGAIAEVYASVMAPDPILYRREHNLIDYVEDMAVLIQKVVGVPMGDYFLPAFAGVAFSRNEYRWSPRIKREDGLMRIVMGLGTRAVDRSGSDYPRMVALAAPTLRPESSVREIVRNAQQTLDVIDLKKNRFTSMRVQDLIATAPDYPMLDRIVSVHRDDELFAPAGARVDAEPERLCVTFDKLFRSTSFPAQVHRILERLERAYGFPVDIEFACDGEKFYLLQCRTQAQAAEAGPVSIPDNIPEDRIIFEARRFAQTGLLERIEYIVYIDAIAYDAVPSRERRLQVARVVGRINHRLPRRSFILIGPGRWGSNDINLGVQVRYADINHSRMLIEVARQLGGFVPEVSFGTHFFQDLVEAGIHYLPLYPDTDGTRFNDAFLCESNNVLADVVPDDSGFADEVRVIHVPASANGRTLTVTMDGETDRAIAYLE